jgi:hypothetical protein
MIPKMAKLVGFLCIGAAILIFADYFFGNNKSLVCPDSLLVFPVGLIFGLLCVAIKPLIGICLTVIGLYKLLPSDKVKTVIPWMIFIAAIILGALAYPFVAANL